VGLALVIGVISSGCAAALVSPAAQQIDD